MLQKLLIFAFLLFLLPTTTFANHCTNAQYQQLSPDEKANIEHYYCERNLNQYFLDNKNDCGHTYQWTCSNSETCSVTPPASQNNPTTSNDVNCIPRTGGTPAAADDAAGLTQIEGVFRNIISAIAGLGFIVLLVMIISAGFKYLTSGGEPKTIQQAHQTVTWALLGIVFMAVGWLLLQLVQAFTGLEVTTFNIRVLCEGTKWCTAP